MDHNDPRPYALIGGDSIMHDAAPALIYEIETRFGMRAVGASVPGFRYSDMWGQLAGCLDALPRPGLVVLMVGGWDAASMRADPGHMNAVLDQLTKHSRSVGAKIVFNSPIFAEGDDDMVTAWDFVQRFAQSRSVPVVDWHRAVQQNGTWPVEGTDPATGRAVLWRKPDANHLCPAGAQAVSRYFADSVIQRGILPAVPSQSGYRWWEDPRYDNPDGGCDGIPFR